MEGNLKVNDLVKINDNCINAYIDIYKQFFRNHKKLKISHIETKTGGFLYCKFKEDLNDYWFRLEHFRKIKERIG